jgi:hypothetical protein
MKIPILMDNCRKPNIREISEGSLAVRFLLRSENLVLCLTR